MFFQEPPRLYPMTSAQFITTSFDSRVVDYLSSLSTNRLAPSKELQVVLPKMAVHFSDWALAAGKVLEFRKLAKNWDGYGAEPPSTSACVRALEILSKWEEIARSSGEQLPAPFVAPCGNGNIQLEWSVGRRTLEIEASSELWGGTSWTASIETEDEPEYFTGPLRDASGPEARNLALWLVSEK